jgi:hypothetical protein
MVAMSRRQCEGAVNDNDLQRHAGFTIEPSNQTSSTLSLRCKSGVDGLSGHVVAAMALVACTLALPLLQSLVVPAITTSEARSEVIRGSPIAPILLGLQEGGWNGPEAASHLSCLSPC